MRDEKGRRQDHLKKRSITLALQAKKLYETEQTGKLEHFITILGSRVIQEWRKNLPEYCTSLACNIISLINLIDRRYEKALGSINESFEAHPTPPEIYFSMGVYMLRQGAFNLAIRMLNESIKKKGEHLAEAYYQLGRAYYYKAAHFLNQREVTDTKAISSRQYKRMRQRIAVRIEKAIEAFQDALNIDPYFAMPYYWIGLACLLKPVCRCQEAIDNIELALQLDPMNISRYLEKYPVTCRSENTVCERRKLTGMIKEILRKAT